MGDDHSADADTDIDPDANSTADVDPDSDPIVGDADGISIGDGDRFDYALSRPDGGEFEFDAADVPTLRELLDAMQGDG